MITLKQTNKFSAQRFALILRYTLRSKACIHSAAISAAMLLLSLMIALNSNFGYWGMEHFMALNSLRQSITQVVVFSALLSASQAFAGLGEKEKLHKRGYASRKCVRKIPFTHYNMYRHRRGGCIGNVSHIFWNIGSPKQVGKRNALHSQYRRSAARPSLGNLHRQGLQPFPRHFQVQLE